MHYWQGNGLVIYRSLVRFLAGHRCIVALGKLLITNYTIIHNLVPAKGVISLAGKVTAGLVESNSSLPPSL